ncbi:FecR family protein [Chitinophaga arvensicola]|uniref:FecR protein n=1 Tax=Chitinophaga arvensicola TaxID=29529 RepID=A0A1I0S968_9BACT|nr:FecR domain-containing protein [Chitinophaga arvensicola]SEW52566.1 protein of unknown function [Chitinophaga arvensicola]
MSERFNILWQGYLDNQLTTTELEAFIRELQATESPVPEALLQLLENYSGESLLSAEREEILFNNIITREKQLRKKSVPLYKRPLIRAAAVILLLAAVGGGWLLRQQLALPSPVNKPVAMVTDKAVLTLADGSQVPLDSAGEQTIWQQQTAIRQQSGQLQYQATTHNAPVAFNVLSTPRGGQYKLVLPDGSKVWLNASSSLRFPTAFTGKEREVILKGEGYFEIAAQPQQPFTVKTGETTISVLGTAFNIKAYENEPAQQTTLLSGSIKVSNGHEQVILQPGKMAAITNNNISIRNADTTEVAAWRNGQLSFGGADIKSILRDVERWYNVDVIYTGTIPDRRFGGLMDKQVPLPVILEFLNENGIHATLKGRTVTVTP